MRDRRGRPDQAKARFDVGVGTVDDQSGRPGPRRPETAAREIVVSEVRDYRAVNRELARLLDQGQASVRLREAGGQRLLAAGLKGPWTAVVEIEGDAGPELAAELDAPGLTVVCRGLAGDGAAGRMRAGRLLVLGAVGAAFGCSLEGGLALAAAAAGARAGLNQRGGDLIVLGPAGALAGERQAGGRLFALGPLGPHAGRGRRAGLFLARGPSGAAHASPDDRVALQEAIAAFAPWLGDLGDIAFDALTNTIRSEILNLKS